jgi:hypothetical protein
MATRKSAVNSTRQDLVVTHTAVVPAYKVGVIGEELLERGLRYRQGRII